MGKNHVIGSNNQMPWHLPKDLKHFKETTMNHTIIMGRKTFESIGRALPKRKNVVLTRNKTINLPSNVDIIDDFDTIIKWHENRPEDEFFVIGGGSIYKQILPHAHRMYITCIDEEFTGDTFFPTFDKKEWTLTEKTKGPRDENNDYDYYFLQYDRLDG